MLLRPRAPGRLFAFDEIERLGPGRRHPLPIHRSIHRIRELFLQPDTTYDVRVKRLRETLTVKLKTRRVI